MRLSATILTLALSSFAFGAGDAAKGKDIYMKKCKSCHAEDGAGTPAMQKKYGDKWRALSSKEVQGLTDAAMTKEIEAAANHKALLKTTTPAEMADVIAFVRTMKK